VPAESSKSDDPALARDHLANERTYLAWLRTAAAVMALGLAVAGLAHRVSAPTAVAGVLLVITGACGVAYGTARYRRVTRELDSGRFVAGGRGPAALIASSVLVGAVVVALVLILVGQY
jgi:putative membrane protein